MIEIINSILSAIFAPILSLPFPLAIFFFASLISVFNALLYKLLIDHKKMREYKKRMEELQKKVKKLEKDDPKKAEGIMKEILQLMNKQFMMSIKPMFASMFFIIIFLPYLSAISFLNVSLDESYSGVFTLNTFTSAPKEIAIKVKNEKVFFDKNKDGKWEISAKEGEVVNLDGKWRVNKIDSEKKNVNLGAVVRTPFSLPVFTYGFGWLMWYIICSTIMFYFFRRTFGINY